MSDDAIRVSGMGKRYRIRVGAQDPARTLRSGAAARPNASHMEDVWAIRDVDFTVRAGEIVGFIGRNGAGKSTILKILSRVTDPTTGRAEICGRIGSLLEVGTGFHPDLSGRDNIFLNGAILGLRRAEIRARFDEIVAFAEIDRFLDTPVKRYSSGMYVRLAFAVAAHLQPEILLVDEVLAVGDTAFQRKCLGKMSEVSSAGRTILFVSHNLVAVEGLCGRALLLERGRLTFDGPVREGLSRYMAAHGGLETQGLAARADRTGCGALRFTGVRLLTDDGEPASCLTTGGDAWLELEYESAAGRALRDVHVSMGIDSTLGQRIAHLSSEAAGGALESLPDGRGAIRIRLPRLGLLPGRYHYTLFCEVGGQIADWVQNAGSFDVKPGDFFGSGRLPPSGVVCLDCSFETESATCC